MTLRKNTRVVAVITLHTGFLLLLVYLFIAISYTFFLHSHTLDDGQRVIHSHPFSNSDNNRNAEHQHGSFVFQLLPDLTNQIGHTQCDIVFYRTDFSFYRPHKEITTFAEALTIYSKRGPPKTVK